MVWSFERIVRFESSCSCEGKLCLIYRCWLPPLGCSVRDISLLRAWIWFSTRCSLQSEDFKLSFSFSIVCYKVNEISDSSSLSLMSEFITIFLNFWLLSPLFWANCFSLLTMFFKKKFKKWTAKSSNFSLLLFDVFFADIDFWIADVIRICSISSFSNTRSNLISIFLFSISSKSAFILLNLE